HEGVLGLVTNKIAEKYHKPTIILTEADNGELKGSGRSVVGFNLFNALIKLKGTVLTKFGGHEFACGLSLKKDSLVKLRNCFESSFQPVATSELVKMYDDELNLNDLTLDTYRQMAKVGPFGTDNPEPVFSITNPHISKLIKIGQNKNHIKMCVSNFSNELDLIGFDRGYLDTNILPYVHMIMVTLGINKWNNKAKLQGIISDFIFAAPPSLTNVRIVDLRNENYIMGFADRYLLFDKNSIEIANNIDNISSDKIILATDYMQNNESVVFLDTPTSKEQFDRVLNNDFNKIYLRFLIDPYPISKLPDRELFESIFNYIVNHPNLSLSDYKLVATYLGINYDCIKFVLRVFWELNWIDYDVKNELIKAITSPKVTKITDSKYFQAISQRLTFTDMLKNMSSDSLLKYIKDHNSNL
ncbi:MAG: single-stranded-DNA-specific exonuclease C-terminal domain-containing protein, partial [Lactobacillus iners]|nr:single-stranded-DNA-specific exonuclease C-terminal domain-containing protein [Lactobacillus iners]